MSFYFLVPNVYLGLFQLYFQFLVMPFKMGFHVDTGGNTSMLI